jgi:ribosomal protein L40E
MKEITLLNSPFLFDGDLKVSKIIAETLNLGEYPENGYMAITSQFGSLNDPYLFKVFWHSKGYKFTHVTYCDNNYDVFIILDTLDCKMSRELENEYLRINEIRKDFLPETLPAPNYVWMNPYYWDEYIKIRTCRKCNAEMFYKNDKWECRKCGYGELV